MDDIVDDASDDEKKKKNLDDINNDKLIQQPKKTMKSKAKAKAKKWEVGCIKHGLGGIFTSKSRLSFITPLSNQGWRDTPYRVILNPKLQMQSLPRFREMLVAPPLKNKFVG